MNNEVLKAMKTRRSIRKYKPEQITDEQLDAILEAGTYAATGMGKQSPVIVVVQKPELIAKLSKMNAAVMGSSNDPFYGAPTVLIVLADPEIGTYHEDGSLVMGNLMLAAHAVGVDSCWIHRAKEEFESAEGKELLKDFRKIWSVSDTVFWDIVTVNTRKQRKEKRTISSEYRKTEGDFKCILTRNCSEHERAVRK